MTLNSPMSEESPSKRSNELAVGDAVWIWNYCNSPRWIPGFKCHHDIWSTELPSPCKWTTPQAAC